MADPNPIDGHSPYCACIECSGKPHQTHCICVDCQRAKNLGRPLTRGEITENHAETVKARKKGRK